MTTGTPNQTKCPTCGYLRPVYSGDEGTQGFVPQGKMIDDIANKKLVEHMMGDPKEGVDKFVEEFILDWIHDTADRAGAKRDLMKLIGKASGLEGKCNRVWETCYWHVCGNADGHEGPHVCRHCGAYGKCR